MNIEARDVSVFANKADALLFFIDSGGNAPKQANAAFPDICQVAQMMTMARLFPAMGLVFTTQEGQKIIVSNSQSCNDIYESLLNVIDEHEIKSINIASTEFFDNETFSHLSSDTSSDVTIFFCHQLV